jgi:nicotinamidase/pyrazinamidase
MNGLLIIDIQNDFITGSLAIDHSYSIISKINQIKTHFDIVILSQDSHPKNHISFASNNNTNIMSSKQLTYNDIKYNQIMWPDHCVKNSIGEKFHNELEISNKDIVVKKGENYLIDSYSVFFDNLKLNQTNLDNILKKHNVKNLYLCGLAFDYCVKFTAIDAKELGYNVNIIKDLTESVNPEEDTNNVNKLEELNINMLTFKDIFKI